MTTGGSTRNYSNTLDNIAQVFSEDAGFEQTLMKYKILEIEKFCKGMSMLDIGCGVGAITKALCPRFNNVTGIDGSEIKIEKAKKHNSASNITYICTLFEKFDPNMQFDFIVAANVLEHVDNPQYFLKKIRTWLASRGRIVITVPNAVGLHKRVGKAMGLINDFYQLTESDIKKGHKRIYDRNTIKAEFLSSDFRIEFLGGILLKPLSHSQMEAWDTKIVDALFEVGKELPEYCSSLIIVATV
jgi:2-polyprenyl-3-methyl-5-hydroxy-6-metoxy-1,4-benzoquinol methylase